MMEIGNQMCLTLAQYEPSSPSTKELRLLLYYATSWQDLNPWLLSLGLSELATITATYNN